MRWSHGLLAMSYGGDCCFGAVSLTRLVFGAEEEAKNVAAALSSGNLSLRIASCACMPVRRPPYCFWELKELVSLHMTALAHPSSFAKCRSQSAQTTNNSGISASAPQAIPMSIFRTIFVAACSTPRSLHMGNAVAYLELPPNGYVDVIKPSLCLK